MTGETWYAAEDVIRMLDSFEIELNRPSWAVNRWMSALVVLFRPQIEQLIRTRDITIADWARRHPDRPVFEDRELEVTSYLRISIADQIEAVENAVILRGLSVP